MTKIKIISNPFRKSIVFQKQQPITEVWENISFESNPNSRLVRENIQKGVLSFHTQLKSKIAEVQSLCTIDLS